MSDAQFTPGPWRLCAHLRDHDKCTCGYRGGIWSGDGEKLVCEMGASPEHDGTQMMPHADRETQFADARMIAAAPDLLAALKEWIEPWNGFSDFELDRATHPDLFAQIKRARAVIAKAEGLAP